MFVRTMTASAALLTLVACSSAPTIPGPGTLTSAELLAQSQPADWRPLDPARTLYLDVPGGRVVIELAPDFAPQHVANIIGLAQRHYFDGLAIVRVQDNYVVQWGDPTAKKDLGPVARNLPLEGTRTADGVPFAPLPDGDVYAPEVGWSDGFALGRDGRANTAWLLHCYGVVGVGRENPPDAGLGNELYAVSGHAPRHLDKNLAVVGRVVQGMQWLTALPRGTGAMGFYEKAEERTAIQAVTLAADVTPGARLELEVLRTDTATWAAWVASRRYRREAFFVEATGRVEVCNVAVPVRGKGK
jgi:peptidylprolyl isomerase